MAEAASKAGVANADISGAQTRCAKKIADDNIKFSIAVYIPNHNRTRKTADSEIGTRIKNGSKI
jgi:hypothetical protein